MPQEIVKPYWYKTVIKTCPLCWEQLVYKYRVYGEKPKNRSDRVVREYMSYHCDV